MVTSVAFPEHEACHQLLSEKGGVVVGGILPVRLSDLDMYLFAVSGQS